VDGSFSSRILAALVGVWLGMGLDWKEGFDIYYCVYGMDEEKSCEYGSMARILKYLGLGDLLEAEAENRVIGIGDLQLDNPKGADLIAASM